jgi:hypothetical protein
VDNGEDLADSLEQRIDMDTDAMGFRKPSDLLEWISV